jgi:hypothetical protein
MERRERTFPITFTITKPTRFSPGSTQMYYAHEWKALQKSLQAGQPAQPSDEPAEPNKSAEPHEPADPVSDASSITSTSVYPEKPTVRASKGCSSSPLYPEKPTAWASKGLPPDFARHARRCSVCSHPDRDAIEGDFIRWRSPELIAKDYKIPDRASIYRHVHSTGLFAWRKRELGRVLEGILESSEHLPLESADVIIRAARIYSHLDEQGNWFDPPRTTFLFTGPAPAFYPLESVMPTNSARTRKRTAKKAPPAAAANRNNDLRGTERILLNRGGETRKRLAGEQKANRNIRQFKKSLKSVNPKEKANS